MQSVIQTSRSRTALTCVGSGTFLLTWSSPSPFCPCDLFSLLFLMNSLHFFFQEVLHSRLCPTMICMHIHSSNLNHFFLGGGGGLIFHQTFHWSSIFSNLNPSHLKACWALDLGAQVLSCWLCIAFGYGWAENKRRDKVLLLLLYLWCEGKRFGLLR